MTERRFISSGSRFESVMGYSRAVVDGDWVHVSGTTGYDYGTMTIADDVAAQTEQVFRNIAAALQQADASLDDVVRVTYYLTDASYFEVIAPICGRYFAKARPAATALICKLIDPAMKIEIEVTARKQG
ncbi:RidA family protein [Ferrovibrio xuzhouensis]|uniref:RidA family protein n=1 Tax=Ferrovibrio xuzhouensis TaxID=1576914 RepID=A0ABV7VN95_9PROT